MDEPGARLSRPSGTPFAGVAAGLARSSGTDAWLWRVGFVVLALFHGLGLVLYLLGYVLMPADDEERSLGQRLVEGPDRHVSGGQALALVLLAIATFDLVEGPDSGLGVVLVLLLGLLWWQHRHPTAGTPTPDLASAPPPDPAVPLAPPPPVGPLAVPPPSSLVPGPGRRATRRRDPPVASPWTGAVLSTALLVAGVLLTLGAADLVSVPAAVVLAAALGVVGLGLVVASFRGSAPGLVVVAVLLAVALGLATGLRPVVTDGVGDRTWRPGDSAGYRLGVGNATLDLASLDRADSAAVDARVEVGHLVVLVPADLHVVVDAEVRLGQLDLFDARLEGHDLARTVETGPADEPLVSLHVDVRLGQLEVRRG